MERLVISPRSISVISSDFSSESLKPMQPEVAISNTKKCQHWARFLSAHDFRWLSTYNVTLVKQLDNLPMKI